MKSELERHCEDCCCARSWRALGINESNGKSIPENIATLRNALAAAQKEAQKWERVARELARREAWHLENDAESRTDRAPTLGVAEAVLSDYLARHQPADGAGADT